MNKYILVAMACGAFIAGCGRTNGEAARACTSGECREEHDHDHDQNHSSDLHPAHGRGEAGEAPADGIVFPAAQAARIGLRVEPVRRGPFGEVIKASGQLLAAQGDRVSLIAPFGGVVSFSSVKLADGMAVSKGRPLFFISSKGISGGDEKARVAAAYRQARAGYERAGSLLADRIVSQKDYDAVRTVYLQAKAEYDAFAGASSSKGIGVGSSMDGYLDDVSVREGDYVEVGQVLAGVSRNRRMTLRAEVSQRYYGRLSGIRSANFTVPCSEKTYSLGAMNGRLLSCGKASSASSGLVPVTFEFDNPGDLLSGGYVEVWLTGAVRSDVLAIPAGALTEQQGVKYVYVQLDDECYERREVATGAGDGIGVEVLSGLAEGERIVTRGAVHVRMAASSSAIPHGHSH